MGLKFSDCSLSPMRMTTFQWAPHCACQGTGINSLKCSRCECSVPRLTRLEVQRPCRCFVQGKHGACGTARDAFLRPGLGVHGATLADCSRDRDVRGRPSVSELGLAAQIGLVSDEARVSDGASSARLRGGWHLLGPGLSVRPGLARPCRPPAFLCGRLLSLGVEGRAVVVAARECNACRGTAPVAPRKTWARLPNSLLRTALWPRPTRQLERLGGRKFPNGCIGAANGPQGPPKA